MRTLLIAPEIGGQSVVSEILRTGWHGQNFRRDLAENLKKHLLAYADDCVTVAEGEFVKNIENQAKKMARF